MPRPKKFTTGQWLKIIETMKSKIFSIQIGPDFREIRAYSCYLPGMVRGLSIPLNNGSAVIMYSKRLRSMARIVEVIKHELIHLKLNDGKHGREFKRACKTWGLDPNKHS